MNNKQTILRMKLMWIATIFSKVVYTIVAYNGYKENGNPLSNSWAMPVPVFLIMGILSALIGVIICRSLMGKIPALKNLANKLVNASNQKDTGSSILNAYLMGLGAIETAAVFGLVGFLPSTNVIFFAIMMSTTIIGWIAANPFSKKQQYV
jgi:hypothetical protein